MIAALIAWVVLSLPITWFLYRIVMHLQVWRDSAPRSHFLLAIAKTFVMFCVAWDFLANVLPTTLIFLEPVIEGSISQRLRRLVKGPDGWRKRFAAWVAVKLVNPYSNGGPHIPL